MFGLIFGVYHWIYSAKLGMVPPTGTVMLVVLPIILSIQFLLQAIVLDVQNVPLLTPTKPPEPTLLAYTS